MCHQRFSSGAGFREEWPPTIAMPSDKGFLGDGWQCLKLSVVGWMLLSSQCPHVAVLPRVSMS